MRNMVGLIVTALFTATTYGSSGARTSDCSRPFATVIQKSELVVKGRVISYGMSLDMFFEGYYSMHVEVTAVLKGTYRSKQIEILGKSGPDCSPYIMPKRFPIGTEFVFALPESEFTCQQLSSRGAYWLRCCDDFVEGRIRSDECEVLSYTDLTFLVAPESVPSN